ncbi:serine-rich adhesin for platelets isoform X8 [Penaeus vannamei]|uniref:serine-rich adhesin for platelets isoform X8 n=1 Tax=Penaeus vannamei TaxID=6689 RepID=UPI00387F553D
MLALRELLSGGQKPDAMEAGSAKPARRRSMACLRMIPRNIVARKRSVFLDRPPVLTDWHEPREDDAPGSGASRGAPSPKSNARGGEGRVQAAGEGEGEGAAPLPPGPERNERRADAAALGGRREGASGGGASSASTSASTAAASTSTSTAAAASSIAAAASSTSSTAAAASSTHSTAAAASSTSSTAAAASSPSPSSSTSANAPTRRRKRGSETCSQDGRTQQVIPLQHGDSLNISDNQSFCQVERALQRSPGDGDEAPRVVTSDDKRENDEEAAMTSQGMRPVVSAEAASGGRPAAAPPQGARHLTSWASGPRHAGHAAQAQDSSGLTCTCPQSASSKRRSLRDTLTLPRLALASEAASNQDDGRSSSSSLHEYPRYRRSISLGQILQHSDGPYSDGFNSAGSTYPGSSETSPDTHTDATGRELSDFEKENLLFLKDLDNSYHRPLTQSLSNTSLGSTFSEDSLTGDSTPRGGSPYPGRREFPRTAYSPSKTSASKIIRSVSREEPEDDLSEGEASRDGRRRPEATGRKISLPILAYRGSTSDSSAPSSVSSLQGAPAWWNSRQVREPPPRKFSLNHTSSSSPSSSFAQAKMVFTGRSLSSPSDPPSRIPMATHTNGGGGFLQEPPWRSPRGLGCASSAVPNASGQDTERKLSSDAPAEAKPQGPEQPGSTPTTTSSSTSPPFSKSNSHSTSSTSATTPSQDGGGGEEVNADAKKQSPMAFTIELGPGGTSATSDASAKKLDITASISKWAPKHRRNLSLTKVEEHKVVENFFDENGNSRPKRRSTISRLDKVEERVGKPPVGRPRSGTVGAAGLLQGRRVGGYHSEGYFSSDQDDEGPRRTGAYAQLKSPRSPRTPELQSPQPPQRVVRSTSQDSAKGASLRKQVGKTEGRSCCKTDKKPTVAEFTGRSKSEKGCKNSKMTPEARKQSNSANSLSSCQTFEVKEETEVKEEKDDVSEAGTYTIEKDSPSPEVEQARNDIDRVFGVSGPESEVDATPATPRGNMVSEESWTTSSDAEKFKSPSSISRSSPNWIQQWAAQVAEHTKSPDSSAKNSLGSPRGHKPPLASLSSSQESSDSRPRRKLPTLPTHHTPFSVTSPRASDMSDHESPTKGRLQHDLYESSTLPASDYSRDTESFLRDTQQLVTSLQARVERKKGSSAALRGSSFESHDSGGDSDLDTSTSYPINDDDDRLMKTIDSQLKTKLKLAGIDGMSKTPPLGTSPRKADPLGLEARLKLTSHFKRERSIVSDSGYDVYADRREENSLQSDSSSEASEPVKDSRKTNDNNPPLKFNRAFSLRRARLACDDSSQQHHTPLPVEKKKPVRPTSAGNPGGSRRIPLSTSKSLQGSDINTRGSASQASTPKNNSADFNRGDGGRFSLRLPRSGSTSAVSKSPSRSSVKKDMTSNIRKGAPRSNSTLSAKEQDFQNWKRRKNYDPMKAAAEGRKKVGEKKNDKQAQSNAMSASDRRSPSPPTSLLRSASFHGTEGMGVAGRWPRRPNHLYNSEDDGPYSLEQEQQQRPAPHCSPLRRSPTSPHQLSSPHTTSPARQATLAAARARRSSYAHSDEGEGQGGSPTRKTSLDESGSEGKRSPMGSTRGTVSGRSKAKMEALDNLVISTIHSLSVKVRTTSETLLQKLKSQYDEEGDRAALLEEVLAHLSESDQTLSSGQTRSTSRELAGILRNLKKIEHALEVIDRVMVCVDDDDLDEDDLDVAAGHEWGESDY